MSTAPIPFPTPDRPFGALLRHYREAAGLSQEALAERAEMSVRAIRYLERGSSRPYPDTLRRLANALSLLPAQQEMLADAAHAQGVSASGQTIPAPIPTALAVQPAPVLVGRMQELAVLRGCLAASLAGQGGLVLLSGEAGVGKSALAEALCWEAAQQGALVLVGHCYDLSETPPYGPWTEACSHFPPSPGSRPGRPPSLPNALHTAARSSQEFFAEVHDFFTTAAMQQPILLLLDDMQWADPASLDLLRFLARSLATLPLLLVVNYRSDGLDQHHPFSQLLPLLVREAHAERLGLGPLSAVALQTLVHGRYRLGTADETRLVTHLVQRTDGNALFATEMLRALEERGIVTMDGDALGNLEAVTVPPLLQQIVVGRMARLGAQAERLLGVAAVIGQEVPLDVWARVSEVDDATVEAVAELGLAVRLLAETRAGVAFAHALIREALYEALPAMRRRRLHRAVGETLAADTDAAPDTVAYHFRKAGDTRAVTWLVQAGWHAYRAFAYETARARFAEALPQLEGTERVRALLALANLDRYRERGVRYAEEAMTAAHGTGDAVLVAVVQFRLGMMLCYRGRIGAALLATAEADGILSAQHDEGLPDFYGLPGFVFPRDARQASRASVLAASGRWRDVLASLGETLATISARIGMLAPDRAPLVWHTCVFLGRVTDAQRVATATLAWCTARKDDRALLATRIDVDVMLLLPYLLDDQNTRQRHDADLAGTSSYVEETLGTVPPYLNRCPLLIAAGQWAEAQALWAQRHDEALTTDLAWNLPHIGAMARARGEREEAWALVREGVPDGPLTEPGTTHFTAVDLLCLATRLTLDAGEYDKARQWLEAHDRWLDWAGPEMCWGRADGQIAWAEYHRATGDHAAARQHAEQAVAAASAPHQPLALLAAHRLLGELATDAGKFAAAADSLQASRALADACAAPYERALTLLALAELAAATGDGAAARALLTEARDLCTPLGAQPALARAERLAHRLTSTGNALAARSASLSAREVEVLRLIAAGHTNLEIAATLSLSVRTIERHVENLYRKIAVHGRAEAIAYAFRNDLA